MKYRELKDQRDAAIARAVKAERLSMKSEFDRVTAEFEAEKQRLETQILRRENAAWGKGYEAGLLATVAFVKEQLGHVEARVCSWPESAKQRPSSGGLYGTSDELPPSPQTLAEIALSKKGTEP